MLKYALRLVVFVAGETILIPGESHDGVVRDPAAIEDAAIRIRRNWP
jgi:hypothetical protein